MEIQLFKNNPFIGNFFNFYINNKNELGTKTLKNIFKLVEKELSFLFDRLSPELIERVCYFLDFNFLW